MGLSKDILNKFVEITRPDKPVNTETTVCGKTVEYNGKMYVQLDGSDLLTPVNTTTSLKTDERVTVMIKNHTATVTGNLSSPSASTKEVEIVGNKITELEIVVADKVSTKELSAERGRIDELVSENVTIKDTLTATNADIINLQADNVVVKETLEANEAKFVKIEADIAAIDAVSTKDLEAINADIHNLEVTYGEIEQLTAGNIEAIRTITDELAATDAAIEKLESTQITTEQLDAKYANIDFANIGMAAVEKLFTESGIIKDLVVGDTSITGELVGVTIKGDIIEGNTVVADKLVVLGSDGLYYKLNTNGVTTTAEQTEYNSLNGSVITAKSITAEKIKVSDLVAFGATIGGFKIGTNSIYSGVKESINNTTRGIYMDKDGQVNFGDSNQYLKYYKTPDGTYALEVCADNIVFGSKRVSVETAIDNTAITSSASGSPILLTDSADGSLIDFKAYGRSTQNQYSGKNLLKLNILNQRTHNGITFTPVYTNDGTEIEYVIANGTATDNAYTVVSSPGPLPAGKYILSGCPSGGGEDTYKLYANPSYYVDYGKGATFELINEYTFTNIVAYVTKGQTVSNLKFYPMIRKAEITDGTYEPYVGGIASPNPDYPQAIDSVADNGYFDGELMQGGYQTSGGAYTPVSYIVTNKNKIPCKEGDIVNIKTGDTPKYLAIVYYKDGIFVTSEYLQNVSEATFTVPNGVEDFHFNIQMEPIENVSAITPSTAKPITVTINGIKHALKVKCIGKNLLNINEIDKDTRFFSYTKYTNEIVKATANVTTRGSFICSFSVYLEKGKTYTFSHESINGMMQVYIYYDKLWGNLVSYLNILSTPNYTHNVDSGIYIIGYYNEIISGKEYSIVKPMLRPAEVTDDTYEPYKEEVKYIPLNEPLRSNLDGSVTDDVSLTEVTRRFKEVVLDGSDDEVITAYGNNYPHLFRISVRGVKETIKNIICTHFLSYRKANNDYSKNMIYTLDNYILINHIDITSVDELKTWLQANPITVVYELAEPIVEAIEPVGIVTYNPITYITSTDDAEMDITYYRNTPNGQKVADLENKAMGAANNAQSTADSATSVANKAQSDIDNLEVGGRNLLLNSKVKYSNSSYPISIYYFGDEKPIAGETYTVTIKGSLGSGKTQFYIYNSGGSVDVYSMIDRGNGIYSATGPWLVTNGNGETAANTFIAVYPVSASVTATSTIEWIKFEKGNRATDWTPAPEDVDTGITNAQSTANNAQTSANKAQSDIDNLEIGGRNLFSGFGEEEIVLNTYQNVGSFTQFTNNLTFDPSAFVGEYFTVSFYAKSPNGPTAIQVYNSNGNPRYFYFTAALDSALSTEWKYYTYTFLNNDRGTSYTVSNKIEIYAKDKTGVLVKKIKVEKGNRATDWTPAPEDVDANIGNVMDAVNDAQTKIVITEASIRKLEDSIAMLVRDENGASLMTQTSDGWVFNISSVTNVMNENSDLISELGNAVKTANGDITALQGVVSKLNTTSDYVRVISYNNQPCIELGEAENQFRIRITNTAIEFVNGSTIMAYINNDKLFIDKAEVITEIQFGNFVWARRANGNFGLMWRGGN